MIERTEFGWPRTTCDCKACQMNCRFMPGYLIPADLERMIPPGELPLTWAESNLLASPGALVIKDGKRFRIPTLVPAVREDHSCIHLLEGRCNIHEVSPFGCAFFDCQSSRSRLAELGLIVLYEAWESYNTGGKSLYCSIWKHLYKQDKVQQRAEVLRNLMASEKDVPK